MSEPVSRETPPVPDVARGVFGSRLRLAEEYAALLAGDGVLRGLIGPREAPRLWERHLLNCAVLEQLVPPDADVCDIGSGAGLPGVVLAIVRPDLRVTLVEPLLRRTTFLDEAVERLRLSNVEVVRARAEELHGQRSFSVVTSRAVASLDRLLDWSMPLVREGGLLLAMKGSAAASEIEAAARQLERYGAGSVSVEQCGVEVVDPPTSVVRVEASRRSPLGYGRSSSRPPKKSRRKGRPQ